MNALTRLSADYLPAIETELRHAVGSGPEPLREYYAMLTYHLGWQATGENATGKRVRPLLCLLCATAVGGDWRTALPMAASLELLHNFTLLHDDIQDNSPLRRGRPTVWTKWGVAQAINAGDAMFTQAQLAPHRLRELGVNAELIVLALGELNHTCLTLTQGQHLDMAFETRARVSVDDYLTMIEGKTGALIAASAYVGARLGGADETQAMHFRAYGRALGLAFQIQDDLLGIWGDPALTGKSAASDLEKRKKSLPVVYGLERSDDFAKAYAQPTESGQPVAELAQMLDDLGARAFTHQRAEAFTQAALAALQAANMQGEAGEALRQLTDQLLNRAS